MMEKPLNYSKITDIEVEGINTKDYPDFSDAYIANAYYDGQPMTDEQLQELNDDGDFLYEQIMKRIF